jgi:dynein heavy chain 1
LGDGDLLEMIGNSKNIPTIVNHLPKMYAGLNSLSFQDDTITHMASKEGE